MHDLGGRRPDRVHGSASIEAADDPPTADVIAAGLTHQIRSEGNRRDARDELEPGTLREFNTNVLSFRCRTRVESRWC